MSNVFLVKPNVLEVPAPKFFEAIFSNPESATAARDNMIASITDPNPLTEPDWGTWLVLNEAGDLIGVTGLWNYFDYLGLSWTGLLPPYRGKGYFKAILEAHQKHQSSTYLVELMPVERLNDLPPMFNHLGFKDTHSTLHKLWDRDWQVFAKPLIDEKTLPKLSEMASLQLDLFNKLTTQRPCLASLNPTFMLDVETFGMRYPDDDLSNFNLFCSTWIVGLVKMSERYTDEEITRFTQGREWPKQRSDFYEIYDSMRSANGPLLQDILKLHLKLGDQRIIKA